MIRSVLFSPENPFPCDTAVVPNSFVIDFAPIRGRRRVNFQPHKLKPLLMASRPEQETRPYLGEIIRRCTRIDSARRRIALLSGRYGELWMRSNAPTVKNVRDPPDARRIPKRNLLSSDTTAVSQTSSYRYVHSHRKNFTLLYICSKISKKRGKCISVFYIKLKLIQLFLFINLYKFLI